MAIGYGPDRLVVRIADDGPGLPARHGGGPGESSGGTGIAGMRTRAEALGGTLTAEPGRGGGFVVRADLPARAVATVNLRHLVLAEEDQRHGGGGS